MSKLPARIKRRRFLTAAGAVIAIAVIWLAGLIRFAGAIPIAIDDPSSPTDAIVVLTGGTGRLDAGFDLLAKGRAGKLFVSGVYRGVDVDRLLQLSRKDPANLTCCVTLGYAADSTSGNAVETAAWIDGAKFKSLRLVTANYHMPRSLLEFRHAMPEVKIIPHPVFPANFKSERWWSWPGSAKLLISEYGKFLLAWLRQLGSRSAAAAASS